MAQITGLGGIFFKSSNQRELLAWYRDVLGLTIEEWGGAIFPRQSQQSPYQVWSVFPGETTYLNPSTSKFMINFSVDDIRLFVDALRAHGVTIVGGPEETEHGLFAWMLDPDGNKIELWQPAPSRP